MMVIKMGGYNMFGSFKPRTKLGRWLAKRGISNTWLQKKSKLNKNTITDLTTKGEHSPTQSTIKKVMTALREVDPNIKADQFWDM
jgi:predicted transcriptional regulator